MSSKKSTNSSVKLFKNYIVVDNGDECVRVEHSVDSIGQCIMIKRGYAEDEQSVWIADDELDTLILALQEIRADLKA